jgi:hypothetical protein
MIYLNKAVREGLLNTIQNKLVELVEINCMDKIKKKGREEKEEAEKEEEEEEEKKKKKTVSNEIKASISPLRTSTIN